MARQLQWAPDALRLAAAVGWFARGGEAVCIADDEHVGWLAPFVRYVLRRRVLIYCHGDDLAADDARSVRRRRRWFDAADAVIAAGRFAADRLRAPYGVSADRIALITNGVDTTTFAPTAPDPALRAHLGLDGARVILAPSRLVPRKGIDRLIDALPDIRRAIPNVTLVVVGDGPQRPLLEAIPAPPGAVRFLGAMPPSSMPALYALSEVVALPNRAEPGEVDGLPLVVLEAQACGRPVIAGRAGGTGEAIDDGRTGLLVDGNDRRQIAAAVTKVLQDADLAARLAAAGRLHVSSASWASRTRQFLDLCAAGAGMG